jgi:hypothetical protein
VTRPLQKEPAARLAGISWLGHLHRFDRCSKSAYLPQAAQYRFALLRGRREDILRGRALKPSGRPRRNGGCRYLLKL